MSVFTKTTQNNFVKQNIYSCYNNMKPIINTSVPKNTLFSRLYPKAPVMISFNKTPNKIFIKETDSSTNNHSRNLKSLNRSLHETKNQFLLPNYSIRSKNKSNSNRIKNVNLPVIPKIINYSSKNYFNNSNNENKNQTAENPKRSRMYLKTNIIKKKVNGENLDYSTSLFGKTSRIKMTSERKIRDNYYFITEKNEEKEKNNINIENIENIKKRMQFLYDKIRSKSLINKKTIPKNYNIIPSQISNKKNNYNEVISFNNLHEYFIQNEFSSIINYAYKEDQNIKHRNYMEDKGKSIDIFNNNINSSLFCLFDGHGGDEVSKFLQNNFYIELKNNLPTYNIENTLNKVFLNLDQKIKYSNYNNVGSTACIVYITIQNNKKFLYCANVGDTKCILTKKNDVKTLSYDDKVTDKNEYQRIIKNGGNIIGGRIEGQLIVSRAFGDWELKKYGVSCIPHIKKIELKKDDKYVIIASDGVWDVYTDMEILSMALSCKDSKELCDKIIESSLMRGSMDNISCFVIKLN